MADTRNRSLLMRIECGKCGKAYRQETPVLQMTHTTRGRLTQVVPEPLWFPGCKHALTEAQVIEEEVTA